MHVHLVHHGDIYAWILGKFARNLRAELQLRNCTVTEGEELNYGADVNHHITHYEMDPSPGTIETRMVTHIDSLDKLVRLKAQLTNGSLGICLSRETMLRLTQAGIAREQLCYVHPAHDGLLSQRPACIGTSCRVHEDGRKREKFLEAIGEHCVPTEFSFKILGEGWSPQVEFLRKKGFEVEYNETFSMDAYLRMIPTLDYYLYMGMDEGHMGWLDAVASGVKTIVTAQGFHLDAESGITHPFKTRQELIEIVAKIQVDRTRYRNAVAEWTWPQFAAKHLEIWRYLESRRSRTRFERTAVTYHDGINSIAEFDNETDSSQKSGRLRYTTGLAVGFLRRKFNMKWRRFRA